MTNKFILTADAFGMSKATNCAVLEGYSGGLLKSVSLTPNGEAFDEAVDTVLPQCEGISVGVHLNLTQGKAICSDLNLLTDMNSEFTNSFLKLFINAYNPKLKEFLPQVEREFRRQIEKAMSKATITHINSNSHIHAIPPIFNLVCRLAKEYQIDNVRTHFENLYFVPDLFRHLKLAYIENFSKKLLLNFLSVINVNTVHKYKLKTNDYLFGTSYEATMDAPAIAYGIKNLRPNNITVEAIIHPCRYEEGTIDNHFDEYMITKNKKLEQKIIDSGYNITGYTNYERENKEN